MIKGGFKIYFYIGKYLLLGICLIKISVLEFIINHFSPKVRN